MIDKKLTDKQHKPFFLTSLVILIALIVLSFIVPQKANAQDVVAHIPPAPVQPMVGGKQKLMEVHIRHEDYCSIYRVQIDEVNYIVNTCGGMVVEAPMQVKLGKCKND